MFLPIIGSTQLIPVPSGLSRHMNLNCMYNIDSSFHTSIKPYYFSDIATLTNADNLQFLSGSILRADWETNKGRKLFLQGIPIINLSGGLANIGDSFSSIFSNSDKKVSESYIYNAGAGVFLNAGIDEIFGISAYISHNYLIPQNSMIIEKDSLNILHSRGFLNGTDHYYNTYNSIAISFRPFNYLLLEAGFGKHFIGDGYRSLLLSENSYNYPYVKAETNFLNIKYNIIWAQLNNIGNAYSPVWRKLQTKYAVFHYFDWRVSRRISIGLFESIIMNQDVGFDVNYLNPTVLFRPVAFYLGSDDNAIMGLNAKLSINSKNILYGQVMIDDLVVGLLLNDIRRTLGIEFEGEYGWFANKWGLQAGFKTFDFLNLDGLNAFAELNIVRPYAYSHKHPEQNYSHFGQGLAHPLGANFVEYILGFDYNFSDFYCGIKFMYAQTGLDGENTHYGQNIFQPTMDGNQGYDYIVESYGNTLLQGNLTNKTTLWIFFEYILDRSYLLSLNGGIVMRNTSPRNYGERNPGYFYLGLRTNIYRTEKLF